MPLHHQQPLATQELGLSDSAKSILQEFDPDTVVNDWGDITEVITTREAKENAKSDDGNRIRSDSAVNMSSTAEVFKAAHECLGINELLEHILLRADNSTVLRVQGVSKTWKHVILRSVQLQQKLFFQAKPPKKDWKSEDIVWNPLLVHPTVQEPCQYTPGRELVLPSSKEHNIIAVSHEIHSSYKKWTWESDQLRFSSQWFSAPTDYIKHGAEESWRRMLLCQGIPRASKVMFDYCCLSQRASCAGAAMGALWNRSENAIRKHEQAIVDYEALLKDWDGGLGARKSRKERPYAASFIQGCVVAMKMLQEAKKKGQDRDRSAK